MLNFFSLNFPLREYFFDTSPAPPRPRPRASNKFSDGPSLRNVKCLMSDFLRCMSDLLCLMSDDGCLMSDEG